MKVIHYLHLMSAFVGASLFISCSSMNEVVVSQPRLTELKNSECVCMDVTSTESRAFEERSSFEIIFDGPDAICSFSSLSYPCDFEKVNVNVEYTDGVLSIIEYPSSDMSECRCNVDASFMILDIPQEDFLIKLYHGDTQGTYDKNTPLQVCRVKAGLGSLTIPYQLREEEKTSESPYLSQLSDSGCLSHNSVPEIRSTRSEEEESVERIFEMIFEGTEAKCEFRSLSYACDFEKVNIKLAFEEDELTIVIYVSGDQIADCMCDVNASFTINNIPDKEFMLRIYRGHTNGEYNEAFPAYSGMIDPKAGFFKIPFPS